MFLVPNSYRCLFTGPFSEDIVQVSFKDKEDTEVRGGSGCPVRSVATLVIRCFCPLSFFLWAQQFSFTHSVLSFHLGSSDISTAPQQYKWDYAEITTRNGGYLSLTLISRGKLSPYFPAHLPFFLGGTHYESSKVTKSSSVKFYQIIMEAYESVLP